jgi:hypothetical protein
LKACIFAGSSLYRVSIPPAVRRFGPAVMGSVFRAFEAGFDRIGIVDGLFGNTPSVWHKEILFAVSQGADVAGAASMGALRAAELWEHGMVGIGRLFRLFRCGAWTDDDELAVIHGPAELDFCPLSDAMANIRYTLRRLRRLGLLDRAAETELVQRMKAKHFSQRTREQLGEQLVETVGQPAARQLLQEFERQYVDIKLTDAEKLIAYLQSPQLERPGPRPSFPATIHWREQFEHLIADVPPLR